MIRGLRLIQLAMAVGLLTGAPASHPASAQSADPSPPIWSVPEVGALRDDDHGRLVRRGRDLVTATYAHLGPNVADSDKRFAGNNLACRNCHLEAGTKRFGLPLWGLEGEFPQYSARRGGEITIEDRVNSCMVRSLNGRALPINAPEMQAIVAYIDFLSTGVALGQRLSGHGSGSMPELDRAADPERGRIIYGQTCAACHGSAGEGVRHGLPSMTFGYLVPPLWGQDSFNEGAGMARLTNAANFIHANMPNGTMYLAPRLSPEESWDVAAFVLSQPRPAMAGLESDFPDLLKKPVDAPYGPYVDGFDQKQHRLGPFGPIRAAVKRLTDANGLPGRR